MAFFTIGFSPGVADFFRLLTLTSWASENRKASNTSTSVLATGLNVTYTNIWIGRNEWITKQELRLLYTNPRKGGVSNYNSCYILNNSFSPNQLSCTRTQPCYNIGFCASRNFPASGVAIFVPEWLPNETFPRLPSPISVEARGARECTLFSAER